LGHGRISRRVRGVAIRADGRLAMLVPGRNGCGSSSRADGRVVEPAHAQAATAQRTWARHAASPLLVAPRSISLAAFRGPRDRIGQAQQGLAWRVAYPCPKCRRLSSPLERSSVASRTPSDRTLHPHPCWGQTHLHILVTLSDYLLPGRFISDRICFSPLRLS
jgi:hypothetical protein